MRSISGRRAAGLGAAVSCLAALGGCATSDIAGARAREDVASVAEPLAPTGPFLVVDSAFNSVDFKFQNLNAVSGGKFVVIRNDGTSDLVISDVSLSGDNPGDFALGDATTCSGATVVPGDNCVIEARFTPTVLGKRTARIVITDNGNGSAHKIPISGTGTDPAVVSAAVGPIDPRHGFPSWYQDNTGRKLELCVEDPTMCLTTVADTTQPPLVDDTASNWIDESFYWNATATINRAIGGKVLLVLALEAAFAASGDVAVGEQIVFGRVRIRIEKLSPGQTYTVTYPFGTKTLIADSSGVINTTTDIGCGSGPCDFQQALSSPITRFLKWDPAVAPAAPAGYLGNPSVDHKITGSPTGNNIFKVQGPNAGGAGINTIQTDLFSLAGKLRP
jgi:hypothetical protein